MQDEIKNENTNIMQEDYLKTIEELKHNTVSKEDYDKMLEENRKLLNSIVEGRYDNQESVEPETVMESSDTYRRQADHAYTNLEYMTAVLNYRDALLAETGEDCFTLHKHGEAVDPEEALAAEQTADVLKQCVEDCGNDPAVFRSLVQQRFQDTVNSYRR